MVNITDGKVELKVPVNEEYVSVVRLLVSGLGNRMGLAINDLEELKLVIGEAFLSVVDKCQETPGLIRLCWHESHDRINVTLYDSSGKRSEVISAADLKLLETLGGDFSSRVVDGIGELNIGFEIKHQEDRPFLFHDRDSGNA